MSISKAKSVVRSVKNFTKGHSEIQVKVIEATSSEAGGPSGALMNEIARASFIRHNFMEIMEIIDKRLNDPGRLWRHVFKSLSLLEFLIYNGSAEIIAHAKNNLHVVKTLREFQYIDDSGRDQGSAVRQKAKDLTDLLADEAKLKEIRSNLQQNASDGFGGHPNNPYGSSGYGQELYSSAPDRLGMGSSGRQIYSGYDEEAAYQQAVQESLKSSQPAGSTPVQPQYNPPVMRREDSDADLQKAIELSKQDYLNTQNNVARQNELILLQDTAPTPPVNMNQYDFFGNPVGQQQNSAPSNPQVDLLGIDFSTPQQPQQQQFRPQQNQMQEFSGLDYSSGNPFTQHNQPVFQQPQNPTPQHNGLNNIFGNQNTTPSSQFNNAFDGGFNAKPLPHQLANDANAQLAEIARNNARTDPFANLIQNRTQSPSMSAHNPFNTMGSPNQGQANQSQNNNFGMNNLNFNQHQSPSNNAFQANNGYNTTNPKTNPFF